MSLETLPNPDLLEQYADMVRWYHYDPMGAKRPSEFDLDDLEAEVRRRLDVNAPDAEEESEED